MSYPEPGESGMTETPAEPSQDEIATDDGLPESHYLNVRRGPASWFFTLDHKRIGVLYLISVSAAFFLGGLFALLLRLELFNPGEQFFSAHTYNQLFTLHVPLGKSCKLFLELCVFTLEQNKVLWFSQSFQGPQSTQFLPVRRKSHFDLIV